MIPPPPSSTLHSILDIYQACQARGEYAKVILETKRGKTMVNFCSCEEGFPTTPARRAGQLPKKRNSPSDVRRSQRRRAAWRAARAAAEPAVSTPAHCSRTQPYSNHLSVSVIPQLDGDIPEITADLFSSGETPVVLPPSCVTSPEESTMPSPDSPLYPTMSAAATSFHVSLPAASVQHTYHSPRCLFSSLHQLLHPCPDIFPPTPGRCSARIVLSNITFYSTNTVSYATCSRSTGDTRRAESNSDSCTVQY